VSSQLGLFDAPPPRSPRTAALRSFHVRSHMPAEEALAGEAAASGWTGRVLGLFRAYSGVRFTPSEVRRRICESDIQDEDFWPPLTSFRRAITDLTKARLLVHHPEDRRQGMFGPRSKESTWELA
jgi:hypothetical protein